MLVQVRIDSFGGVGGDDDDDDGGGGGVGLSL